MKACTLALALLLAGCAKAPEEPRTANGFPQAARPVAKSVSGSWSTEPNRDRAGEAEAVMHAAGVKKGMTVADIGAGEGYYTIRLAARVGAKGRVLAEDIDPLTRDQLSDRVQRERLDNVAVKLGTPDDPMLPAGSFDRVFLVHMYHEVQSPYAFLWHVREAAKPDGEFIVVDSDRPVERHGIPPAQLKCEFAAVGMKEVRYTRLRDPQVYLMAFKALGQRPAPEAIRPCRA